jgi:hypothetical protein
VSVTANYDNVYKRERENKMQVKDLITSRVCGNTVFEESWIWYCDECRQHGTAISSQEADFMATAHWNYNATKAYDEDWIASMSDEESEEFFETNTIYYRDLSPRTIHQHEWDNDECVIYVIDEANNITYDYMDDYEDKTPNNVTDLQTMIDLQKKLGLE